MKFDALKRTFAVFQPFTEKARLIQIFLLIAWALMQYSLGNKFYGLFIIVFFLILAISRPPAFMLVAVSVLVIVLFTTPTMDTLAQLRESNLNTIRHLKQTFTKVLTPNSGEEVLPVQVQQMLSLLRTHHITNYQLSEQFAADPLIMQRITEAAWPIKRDSLSAYILSSLEEAHKNSTCTVIDQEDVALVYCN